MNTETTPLERAVIKEIRAELAANEWTQADLAKEVGVGREAMNRYLKGRTVMPFPVVIAISEAFGLGHLDIILRAENRLP